MREGRHQARRSQPVQRHSGTAAPRPCHARCDRLYPRRGLFCVSHDRDIAHADVSSTPAGLEDGRAHQQLEGARRCETAGQCGAEGTCPAHMSVQAVLLRPPVPPLADGCGC